jgi:hypothetical protein
MAKKTKGTKKPAGKRSVKINVELYRSLVLDKLRAEIKTKRAALEIAKIANLDVLNGMTYWKMKYWKKGAELNPGTQVVNPPNVAVQPRGGKGQK